MEVRKDRVYFELNENTCTLDSTSLKIVVPSDQQSINGVDFYFAKDFVAERKILVKSVTISPAPLQCFWNWLLETQGCQEYQCNLKMPKDVSIYQISGVPGGFGFCGYAPDGSDITITFELAES